MEQNHYARLFAMAGLSFGAMYALMYAMVDSASAVYNNLNQIYMAGLMTAAMVLIELWLMRAMFRNRTLNQVLMIGATGAAVLLFALIRQQTALSDRQFLRSMIPHHSAAILMCEEASITDPRVERLCAAIVSSQQAEIDQMKAILRAD